LSANFYYFKTHNGTLHQVPALTDLINRVRLDGPSVASIKSKGGATFVSFAKDRDWADDLENLGGLLALFALFALWLTLDLNNLS
jgi:hypothetical protein